MDNEIISPLFQDKIPTKNVVLLGRTGVGKSYLGNKILGREEFEVLNREDSVTRDISMKKGNGFAVYDTPGFGDTCGAEDHRTVMLTIVELDEQPIDALLYFNCSIMTGRVDKHLREEVMLIHHFFGPSIFDRMIIVFNKFQDDDDDIPNMKKSYNEVIESLIQKKISVVCMGVEKKPSYEGVRTLLNSKIAALTSTPQKIMLNEKKMSEVFCHW